MTVPPAFRRGAQRVSDMVREWLPGMSHVRSPVENDLRAHLRSHAGLHDALRTLITARIEGRARLSVPSDPLKCYESMARDNELRLLIRRLDELYHAPADESADEYGEQPAA